MIDLNDATPLRPMPAIDGDGLVARLREAAETWAPRLFPNGRRVGDEWRLANIGGAAPRKSGSCVIALKGPRAGDWFEHDGGEGGGPLSAIEAATRLTGQALIVHAADLVGLAPGAPEPAPSASHAAPGRDAGQEIARILAGAVPARGTPVERYLAGRGLALPASAELLFHPNLMHWESRTALPAMLGLVRDRDDAVIGLHRTYLREAADGVVGKAAVASPRMMLGHVAGGAVRLGACRAGARLALCEGVETGLAAMTALPDLAVWATLSASGLERATVPDEAGAVLILADHDASGAGRRSAEAAARRLRKEGWKAAIAQPPLEGEDFNDLLLREGPGGVAQAIELAQTAADHATRLPVGRHRPLNFAEPGPNLPMLRADEGDLARAVERVWAVLVAANRTPWLFRYGGLPTWVAPDDEGRPAAAALTEDRLRYMLARLADWRRMTAKGELVPAPPPLAVVRSVLATPDPGLPVLLGIVNTPVFGRNGALLTSPGYHPDARLLYVPTPGFAMPPISARPTDTEVTAARRLICDDLLGDFPFVGSAERAHAVALLLLGFLRGMIDGPTPLHMIEKPTPGTGATLMVDAIATILTGAGASVMAEGRDDEEWRKRVTAKLRQIPSVVTIDNLRQTLDSSAVAAALTAPFWEDRVLGQSEMVRLPIRCVWIATGNNPEVSNEMARRLVRIRLDANVERPWQRGGFRHPDLMTWVRANRAQLVAACLTLGQAWIAAHRPYRGPRICSYETWAQVVGGVLEVAGVEGFLGNLDATMDASDAEGDTWSGFITAWWLRFGTAAVGVSELFAMTMFCDSAPPLSGSTDRAQRTSFGMALKKMRDRVFRVDGRSLRLEPASPLHGAARWRLKLVEPPSRPAGASRPASSSEPRGDEVNLETGGSPAQATEHPHECEPGEPSEPFSTLTHARAHAHAIEDREKGSPGSPGSQRRAKTTACAGEPCGEPLGESSRGSPIPLWLQEADDDP